MHGVSFGMVNRHHRSTRNGPPRSTDGAIMGRMDRRSFLKTVPAVAAVGRIRLQAQTPAAAFGQDYPYLDTQTTGEWWAADRARATKGAKPVPQIIELNVPRDQVVAFALYTHDAGVLKMTALLYPLKPDEPREARLEVERDGAWKTVA